MKYPNLVDTCHKAQNLIDNYCSDAHVEILKHSFPYVVRIVLMKETHTFRIIKKRNLRFMMKVHSLGYVYIAQ